MPSAEQKRETTVTPLPRLPLLAVGVTFLTESICSTMLFPFVGLYVAHLQHISVEEAGYSSGILVGLFMLGQVVSAKMWGWLSDVYGRKLPLSMGLFAGAWSMLFFGMAPNIYVCCVMRFIHGFFNGNVLIAKIIIADLTDETNAAHGFAICGFTWSLGCIVGPAIGGFLYDPLDNPKLQWMHVKQDSFLARNPAFLPSLFVFIYTLADVVMTVLMLPETNEHHTKSLSDVPLIGGIFARRGDADSRGVEGEGRVGVSRNIVGDNSAAVGKGTAEPRAEERPCGKGKAGTMTFAAALRDPIILTISILYMCISGSDICFGEIMPLWAIAPRDVGGLAMFADEVGTLMLLFAVPTFISTFFFSTVYNKVGSPALMWQGGMAVFALSSLLMPLASQMRETPAFWYVLVLGSMRDIMCSSLFDVIHILTAQAAPPGELGAVYGVTQSMAGIVRCIVPFVVAPLFAWSISGSHVFPFDYFFVFILSVIPLVYSVYLSLTRRIVREGEDMSNEAWNEAGHSLQSLEDGELTENHTSLAHSFAMSTTEAHGFTVYADVQSARQETIREWMQHTAPRGRGKIMDRCARALQQEDWRRLASDEEGDRAGAEEFECAGDTGYAKNL